MALLLAAQQAPLVIALHGRGEAGRGLEVGARDARVEKLFGVGLALSMFDLSFLLPVAKPKAFIQGERDEFASGAQAEAFVAKMAEPRHLEVIPGASHLFPGKLVELEAAVARAVEYLKMK